MYLIITLLAVGIILTSFFLKTYLIIFRIYLLKIEDLNILFINYLYKNFKNETIKFYKLYDKKKYNKEYFYQSYNMSYAVLRDLFKGTENKIINGNSISILGDTSLADNKSIIKKYHKCNNDIHSIVSENITKYLNAQSLVIANAEFAVGYGGHPLKGKKYTYKADPSRISIFKELNVDLVTLANNHVYDYGKDVFLQMFKIYDEYNIQRIGAGRNLKEAGKACYYIINGYKIAFVNANRSEKYKYTPGATKKECGVLRCYNPDKLISIIEREKKTSDFVIAIIHWGKENSHEIEKSLTETSHMYIDAGADAIIGHHAHVLQGIEYYNNKPIFYNIGNFIFGNLSVNGAIVNIKVEADGKLKFYFLPTLQSNKQVDFIYSQDKTKLLKKVNSWGINSYVTNTCKVENMSSK